MTMLASKYRNEFLENEENKLTVSDIDRIIEKEEVFGVECIDWDKNGMYLELYLKSFHSISSNALSKAMANLREFTRFICDKEGITEYPDFKLQVGRIDKLIDNDKLMSIIINWEEYKRIIDQLESKGDIRSKVIVELAWLLLTTDEIQNLKKSDVEFSTSDETGLPIVILHLGDKRVTVEDPEVVKDIDKCLRTIFYYIKAEDGKDKTMEFKDVEYLIRPVKAGKHKQGEEDNISNPSNALQKALKTQKITCPGIDILSMNIENIRRSKIIFLLAPENADYLDKDIIMQMLGSGNVESQLSKYAKNALMKYGKK